MAKKKIDKGKYDRKVQNGWVQTLLRYDELDWLVIRFVCLHEGITEAKLIGMGIKGLVKKIKDKYKGNKLFVNYIETETEHIKDTMIVEQLKLEITK